ncbi:MAG: hemolysin family protein [Candidatus Binatia bacterium]|nr:hemolysin family protein [Candidatus Binatia bacterium]
MENLVVGSFITALFVFANALFVAAQFAIVKVRAAHIELRAHPDSPTAKLAQHIVAHPDAYLLATQLGITLASLGLGWIGQPVVAPLVLAAMSMVGLTPDPQLSHQIALPVTFVVLALLHLVCGELAPKVLALRHPGPTALAAAFPLQLFYLVLYPAIAMLNWIANRLLSFLGMAPACDKPSNLSGYELQLLWGAQGTATAIEETEHELIENVFDFRETTVKEIMVPRAHIVALDIAAPPQELIKTVVEEGYTRMPVYDGTLDNIIGIVHAKDLIALLEHKDLIILHDILRPAYFVPETKLISRLLRELQQHKLHMAIAVDEFGGTAGLVTMEDILEELVGEIQDEHDEEVVGVERIAEGTYVVNAALPVADVNAQIEGFALPEGEGYTTVSGLVNKWFGRIPEANESCERDRVRMTVLKTDNHHVVQVKLEDLRRDRMDNGVHAFAGGK